jgi:hypothetical protein
MAKVMHGVLLEATKVTFVATSFITVSADEVMAIDNTQWLFIHLYMLQNWKRIPILLCMEIVNTFATFDNIFALMLKCLGDLGGLGLEDLL